MPAKKNGTSGTKKTNAKKPVGKTRASSAKAAPKGKKSVKKTGNKTVNKTVKKTAKEQSTDRTPFYIILIMILLTAVVLLVNNYVFNSDNKKIVGPKAGVQDRDRKIATDKPGIRGKTDNSSENMRDREADVREKKVPDKELVPFTEYNIFLVKFDKRDESMSLMPVKRRVSAQSPLSETLNELIRGPNQSERKKGLLTAVPEDLKIRSISVNGRNAVLDFNGSIEENADGQILLTRIDQLVYTATQFEGIDGVIIKVNGKQKKFLGGEGLSVSGPIRRR